MDPILPIEVQAHVLSFLDVKRLLISRLVCKSWNEEICQILQRHCRIRLHCPSFHYTPSYMGKLYQDFLEFLHARDPELPLPLKDIFLRSGSGKALTWDIPDHHPRPQITQMFVVGVRDSPSDIFLNGLKASSRTLKDLFLDVLLEFPLNGDSYEGLHFPNLETLRFSTKVFGPPENLERKLQGLSFIVRASPRLRNLIMNGTPRVSRILEKCPFQNIQLLSLDVDSDAIDTLLQIDVPRLKFLKLVAVPDVNIPEIFSVIHKFSGTIQSLELPQIMNFRDADIFPECPHLRKLSLNSYKLWGGGRLSHLPRLRHLAIQTLILDCERLLEVVHDTVESVKITELACQRESAKGMIMRHVFGSFPGATQWDMSDHTTRKYAEFLQSEWAKECPNISGLRLDPSKGEAATILNSAPVCFGVEFLDLHDWQKSFVQPGNTWSLSNFSNLQKLGFYWHESMLAADVIPLLKDIKIVLVRACCKIWPEETQKELEKLFLALSNVHCGCERTNLHGLASWETERCSPFVYWERSLP